MINATNLGISHECGGPCSAARCCRESTGQCHTTHTAPPVRPHQPYSTQVSLKSVSKGFTRGRSISVTRQTRSAGVPLDQPNSPNMQHATCSTPYSVHHVSLQHTKHTHHIQLPISRCATWAKGRSVHREREQEWGEACRTHVPYPRGESATVAT